MWNNVKKKKKTINGIRMYIHIGKKRSDVKVADTVSQATRKKCQHSTGLRCTTSIYSSCCFYNTSRIEQNW